MTYKADCTISQPKDQGPYRNRRDMGGFGWHPDRGMYIPLEAQDNIALPYPTGMNPTKVVDPLSVKPKTLNAPTIPTMPPIDYDYRP